MQAFHFDTETYKFRRGLAVPRLVCLSYDMGDGQGPGLVTRDEGVDIARSALDEPLLPLVGHNVAFDLAVLCRQDPELIPLVFRAYEECRVHDTRIREKLIMLARGMLTSSFAAVGKQRRFGLADIYEYRFKIDLSEWKHGDDAWRLRYAELDGVPVEDWPADARQYALDDAARLVPLLDEQALDAERYFGGPAITNEHETAAAAWGLYLLAAWGIRTDSDRLRKLDAGLEEAAREVKERLTDLHVFRSKDGSKDMAAVKRIVEAAYNAAGLRAPTTAGRAKKDGTRIPETSTAKDVLEKAPAEGQPLVVVKDVATPALRALASISAIEHNRSTYIEALRHGEQFPVTPSFDELLESGRTSFYNPNIQNLPRNGGFRECIVPRPGFVFINTDYSTVELCALAQVCIDLFGYSKMGDAINAGMDLHVAMAADIMAITYDEAMARLKAGDKEVKAKRQMSKALNFGFPGGLGAGTAIEYAWTAWKVKFAEREEDAIRVVKEYKNRWLAKWPEMREFFNYVAETINQGGGVAQFRQPRSGRLRGGCGYCDGCNTHFQGLAADGAKAALFAIQQECYTGSSRFWTGEGLSPLHGSRLVAFVHDEFVGEAPEHLAAESAERLAVVARLGMELYIPDVRITAEPVLMRRWYKDAATTRDASGRLVCWEPA